MKEAEKSLAWHPMPDEPRYGPVTSDGWRDYGHDRRQRVPMDLERLEKRQKQPCDR